MSPEFYTPSLLLQPYIKGYLIIESEQQVINRVLPDTLLVMAFRFRGQVSYVKNGIEDKLPMSVISGLRKSARLIKYSRESGNILVQFKEGGAQPFIKEPLYELFGNSISLDNFSRYQHSSILEEQLYFATGNEQRIHLIEHFLSSRILYRQTDKLILGAMDRIRFMKGVVRIKELADSFCISQDAFEKRFRKTAAISPKQYAYITRMKWIVANGLKGNSLVDTAFNVGYYDQPHFNKDFKLFTGQTPTEFLKAPVFW